jgi:glycine cleavage system H protein
MSQILDELRYTRSHEWVRELGNGVVEIGISDHAQAALGDIVFVEIPEVGRPVTAGGNCAVVESVKAASDVYSPVAGTVVATNADLGAQPELVNQQPYAAGWLLRVAVDSAAANPALLSASEYREFTATGHS